MAEMVIVEQTPSPETQKEVEMDVKQMVLSYLDEAERTERDAFLNVMADLKSIWMAAKDLHYHAKGEPFYGIHLLADMLADSEKFFDEIAEIYFLGEKSEPPPDMRDIFGRALGINLDTNNEADRVNVEEYGTENDLYLKRLIAACNLTIADVEKAKTASGTLAGTQAVLDEISKTVLKGLGLLNRTDKN